MIVAEANLPLQYGFAHAYKISYVATTVFNFPATYATAFGFMFAYGR